MNRPESRVAVVGLACRLSGAHGPDAFWQNVANAKQPFVTLPKERFDREALQSELPLAMRTSEVRGALIEDAEVDWRLLKLPPLQLERMHRMEKMALATMCEALADGGIEPRGPNRPRAQVLVAATTLAQDPATAVGRRIRRFELQSPVNEAIADRPLEEREEVTELVERLFDLAAPPIDPDSVTSTSSMIAGRLANIYDFQGGHLAVDAADASSLVALERACELLQNDEADLVVVCAFSPLLTASSLLRFAYRGWLSNGELVPYAGQGTVLGEGVIAVVLAKSELYQGKRIYAHVDAIRTVGLGDQESSDRLREAVERAAAGALAASGRELACLTQVITRAPGIAQVDRAEVEGLKRIFGEASIRSVAAITGHLQAASGMAAFLNATLAIAHKPLAAASWVGVCDAGLSPMAGFAVLSSGEGQAVPRRENAKVDRQPMAIVGCGTLVPRASDTETFWRNTLNQVDAIGDVPASRWDAEKLVGASQEFASLLRARLAGIVELPEHYPSELKLSESELLALDPAVLLALLTASQALHAAGYKSGLWPADRVEVIFGQLPLRAFEIEAEKRLLFCDHLSLVSDAMAEANWKDSPSVLAKARAAFNRTNPAFSPALFDVFSSATCSAMVARAYGFTGRTFAVDAACASGLAAMKMVFDHLRTGVADVVVVGAVAYNVLPEYYFSLSQLGFLSTNAAPPFDAKSTGFVPAEGAGCLVLKRASDARQNKDPIVALVSGIGQSSDGGGQSVFAPSTAGQQRAMRQALAEAHVEAQSVSFIEAHGAGTKLGDQTEGLSYRAVYGSRAAEAPLSIGTMKSQIGHLSAASGMLGVIKASLALREKILPPSNSEAAPDPQHDFERHSFVIANQARVWVTNPGQPRRATVTAIGLGGINYHVVLEEASSETPLALSAALSHPIPLPPRGTYADRFTLELVPLALPTRPKTFSLSEKHVVIVGESGPLAEAARKILQQRGARPSLLAWQELPIGEGLGVNLSERLRALRQTQGPILGLLDLTTLSADPVPLSQKLETHHQRMFALLREVVDDLADAEPGRALFASLIGLGGHLGLLGQSGGNLLGALQTGLAKGLKQELRNVHVKVLDFAPLASPSVEELAVEEQGSLEQLLASAFAEIEDGNERVEVGFLGGRRFVANLQRMNFAEHAPSLRRLGPKDVFVVSGGSRGIVFECACALAALGVQTVISGRTVPPRGDEAWLGLDDEAFAEYKERAKLTSHAAGLTPVAFAQQFAAIHHQRELALRLERVKNAKLPIRYETCDVTSLAAVRALVSRVRQTLGEITGVVHGAMVESSRSLAKKTPEIVRDTFAVKVHGLENLIEATLNEPLRHFVCFGSGAGRFGNRGQVDYSAANALMAATLNQRLATDSRNPHYSTIDWTAWEGVGAAADPQLSELVRASGVSSIRPEEGVYWFLHELCLGRSREEVIFAERMLHTWPGLGSRPEGRLERRLALSDHGRPLVPGEWPLCDRVIKRDRLRLEFVREVSVKEDPYILHHRLYETPILPATFGCEVLAEAAALSCPDFRLESGHDFHIGVPVKLFHGAPLTLEVTAQIAEVSSTERVVTVETHSQLLLNGHVLQADRLHHRARFVLRREVHVEEAHGQLAERNQTGGLSFTMPEGLAHARSFFHMVQHPVGLGPIFCRAEWIHLGEQEVFGQVRPPRMRDLFARTSYPILRVDPLVLDAAFQIAANWDGLKNDFVSIPMSLQGLRFGRLRQRSEGVKVRAVVVEVSDPDVSYDITLLGEDNAFILGIERLVLRRIGRISHPEVEPAAPHAVNDQSHEPATGQRRVAHG